jgi:hypothetical protein
MCNGTQSLEEVKEDSLRTQRLVTSDQMEKIHCNRSVPCTITIFSVWYGPYTGLRLSSLSWDKNRCYVLMK